jgi:hypothetical protein
VEEDYEELHIALLREDLVEDTAPAQQVCPLAVEAS